MEKLNSKWAPWLPIMIFLFFTACEDNDSNPAGTSISGNVDAAAFIGMAASSNLYEIRAGSMARDSAMNLEVKQFGQMMADDHTMAMSELRSLAGRRNMQIPDTLTAKHAMMVDSLVHAAPGEFDSLFTHQMVVSHQEAVMLFESASTDANDSEVRDWAAKKLPALRMHLSHAIQLHASTDLLQ